MHRQKRLWVMLACLALATSACGGRPRVPTVTPQSTQITGVVASGLAMQIDLAIHNPNAYALVVQSVTAEVTAQGRNLGTVETAQQIELPAGQNVPIQTSLTVPWGDLPSLAATALLSASIPYHVNGRVRVAGPGGVTMNPRFQLDGQIPRSMLLRMPGIPNIGIPGISFKQPTENGGTEPNKTPPPAPPADAAPPPD